MENYKRILGYLKPYRFRVGLAVILMFLVTLSAIPMPLIQKQVLDVAIPERDSGQLVWLFFAVLALHLGRGVVSYGLNSIIAWLGQRVVFDLRFQLYRHLQRLALAYYDNHQPGKLMARLTGDIDAIQYALTSGVVLLITDLATLFLVTGWLVYLEPRLAAIAIAVVPLYVLNYKLLLKKIRATSVELRERWEAMMATLTERIGAIEVVKAFAHEKEEIEHFKAAERGRYIVQLRQTRLNRFLGASSGFIRMLGTATVLWMGGRFVLGRELRPGELLAFYSYLGSLYDPAVRVVDFNVQLQWASAAIDRVFETLDTRAEITDAEDAVHLSKIKGDVVFDSVTFGYDPEQPVIHSVSFAARAGEMVALVGRSGSGKSTLVHLLARFYEVSGGRITIDGHDVKNVRLETLRRHIGLVAQETILFSVSLRENIRYGRKDATEQEVIAAAQAADLHEFIQGLPEGYDTRIGEDGIKLSGGQKQRMAIARALLADPRILVLDDATSALDSHTEANVQAALAELMKGRTSFVIAHRLSTILNADKIVVLSEGRVEAIGTHSELIAREGVYQDLYNEQFKTVGELSDDEKARLVALAA